MSLTQNNDANYSQKKKKPVYGVHSRYGKPLKPMSSGLKIQNIAQAAIYKGSQKASPAVEMIRRKIDELYSKEPSAKAEYATSSSIHAPQHRSKHQQFMYRLSTSGMSLARIQTEWHNYYVSLPDHEKHEVWREFYDTAAQHPSHYGAYVSGRRPDYVVPTQVPRDYKASELNQAVVSEHMPAASDYQSKRSVNKIKHQLMENVRGGQQIKAKHHIQSLVFGLGLGGLVLVIFLFSFFNQVVIAPLIQPSRNDQNTPIIINTSSVAPSSTPQVIIPKINVQIPVIYSEPSVNDADIENSLEDGVLHYPTTVYPGQQGNAAFFGHSSNNIFNPGKYKFAFVLLHTLVPGDIFYLTYNNQVYAYKVFNREIVNPNDVSVLDNVPGQVATATLITCDPPGTSINRLVVWGEQISPSPSSDAAPTQTVSPSQQPTQLANDGPTLWSRFTYWLTHLL